MFSDKRKYLFAAALLILIAFCAYFYYAFSHVSDVMLKEKIIDRQFDVDLICTQIDKFIEKDDDWHEYDYTEILSFVVSFMDATGGRGTYSELFSADLHSLSNRSPLFEEEPFNPKEYPELINAMKANECGNMTVWLGSGNVPAHDLYIYYRWIPTDGNLENRLLMIVGVSKYSLDTAIGAEIIYGAVALIITASVFIISAIILLCQLGNVSPKERNLK